MVSLKEARARRHSMRALSLVRGQSLYNRLARSTRAGGGGGGGGRGERRGKEEGKERRSLQ